MANELRAAFNLVSGTLSSSLTNVATSMSSAGLANLGVVDSTNHAAITIENEIVKVTAHTAGATTATIVRAQEGTSAAAHNSGVAWQHGPTALDINRVWNPPRAGASRSSTQSISNGAWNLVTFTTEDHDTDTMFSTGTGDRFTCVTAGRYVAIFNASFASNATGLRGFAIAKGVTVGTGFFAEALNSVATSGGHVAVVTGEIVLAVGDTVSCQVFQNSGGALNLAPGTPGVSEPLKATIRCVAAT